MSHDHEFNEKTVDATLGLRRREITDQQRLKFEGYAAEIFAALGMKLDTPATAETPRRFIQALYDATEGYEGDPKLIKVFTTECRGGPDCRLSQVIEGPIQFVALCEHHALPFYGQAYIGYIAHEHIIGISIGVNRVSIGVQSFAPGVLAKLGRRHGQRRVHQLRRRRERVLRRRPVRLRRQHLHQQQLHRRLGRLRRAGRRLQLRAVRGDDLHHPEPRPGHLPDGHPLLRGELLDRRRRLYTGLAMTAGFILLRAWNGYGEPAPWSPAGWER